MPRYGLVRFGWGGAKDRPADNRDRTVEPGWVSQKVAPSSGGWSSGPSTDDARSARFTAYPGWACRPLRVSGRSWGIVPSQMRLCFQPDPHVVNRQKRGAAWPALRRFHAAIPAYVDGSEKSPASNLSYNFMKWRPRFSVPFETPTCHSNTAGFTVHTFI